MISPKFNFTEEAKIADRKLADQLKKLGALREEKIKELLPERADQEILKQLIKDVNSEANSNRKKTLLLNRLSQVSDVVKQAVETIAPIVKTFV